MLVRFKILYHRFITLRFIMVGCLNTLFGYLVFSIFTLFGLHYTITVLLALLSGILFNFYSYGTWVFYNNNPKLLLRFGLIYLLLYGMDTLSLSLMKTQGINIFLAQALVTFPLVICTYLLTRYVVFNASHTLSTPPCT